MTTITSMHYWWTRTLRDGFVPNVMQQCLSLMKSKSKDPDLSMLHETLADPHQDKFLEAMRSKIWELKENGTWTVVKRSNLPDRVNILSSILAFRINRFPDSRVRKSKARFCAHGDRQMDGVEYFKKYAPVVSWLTVRMMLVISLNLRWHTRQVNFLNVFVQAKLEENVYITIPQHFADESGMDWSDVVLKLEKSLYRLVKAPMYWYNHL